ncbi:hypothetical protein GKQ77_01620 [Streptomyces sp. BG9H]|uniref:Secreted protein n=1 Tax=Streptomyces anatolicus TaxID=2675858 RepID=A0ABS6YFT7_9ACTN|nr:hypothetical protein [Streptomyces anatolicus]MBW5420269.1 hypothetical protein [Streptomyces anatolicus]
MNWSSLLSTGVGALIGVSATLAAEWTRWKRNRHDNDQAIKRQTYAEYLAALSRTRNELRMAAWAPAMPREERARLAQEAFKAGGAYELRYQVALLAPEMVDQASIAAFRTLRDLRDVVEAGVVRTEEPYIELRVRWDDLFAELRRQMRADLQQ